MILSLQDGVTPLDTAEDNSQTLSLIILKQLIVRILSCLPHSS
jgi:hypothetical protein